MLKQITFYIILTFLAYWAIKRTFGKEYLGNLVSNISWYDVSGDFASFVGATALFYFIPRLMIEYGLRQNVAVGALALIVWIAIMIQIAMDLRSDQRNRTTVLIEIANYSVTMLMLAVNICAALSYLLTRIGIANYGRAGAIDYGNFVDLHMWHFIDVIPLVRVWDILNVKAPMTINNVWAGIPVLTFQVFVIFEIIRSIREWLAKRKNMKVEP